MLPRDFRRFAPPVSLDLLLLVAGLALLVGGGDALVRGAASIAQRVGISHLAVGLTVVSFGTSAPELAVNWSAVWSGSPDVSFGNVIGSNMANIGLIIGATALLRPLHVHSIVVSREMPMMILATAAIAVFGLDAVLSGREAFLDRGDGIVLLLFFSVFLYYIVNDMVVQRSENRTALASELVGPLPPVHRSLKLSLVLALGGLLGLALGGRLTVYAAVELARALGVTEAVIALSVIAVGTSLPELAASLVAAFRAEVDIAVGNVVGSNIFNLLLVAGSTATMEPIPVPAGGLGDLAVVSLLSALLWGVSASRLRRIVRAEAGLLFAVYVVYLTLRSTLLG